MNAPLSRFLMEFSGDAVALQSTQPIEFEAPDLEPLETEPMVTLPQTAFEQHLATARMQAAAEMRAEVETQMQDQFDAERAEMVRGFEAEREAWVNEQGGNLSANVTAAVAQLQSELATALATALRPLFAKECRSRILSELKTSVEAILGDPGHPPIRIEGPVDLLTAFGNTHAGDLAIDYVVSERSELTVISDTTRITTRLSECLAHFQASEG